MGHNRRVTHPFHRFEKDIIGLFWKLWNRKHHQNHYHFLLLGLRPQLNKIHNPVLLFNNGTSVSPAVSAPNLRIIFDSHLTFEDQISSVSRACFYHIRDLRRIRSVKNFNTAKTIGTSFVHYRHDFCNSLYYGLPKTQLNHLQHIQNSLASAVVAAPIDHPTLTSFLNLSIGWGSQNALNIKLHPLLISFSRFLSTIPSWSHHYPAIRSTRSSSVVTRSFSLVSKSPIPLSATQHPISGTDTDFLHHLNYHVPPLHLPVVLHSLNLLLACHIRCSTLVSKHTFSPGLFLHSFSQ